MRTKKNNANVSLDECILVSIDELKAILSVGTITANKIAEDAGACVKYGKRKLYRLDKIREYVKTL